MSVEPQLVTAIECHTKAAKPFIKWEGGKHFIASILINLFEMTTAQKTTFAIAAMEIKHPSLLFEMDKLCKSAIETIPRDDKDRVAFIEAYKAVNFRVFQLRTALRG